ncbi:antitoxin [Streptomyces sp. D2-8]|uniref:antitoxin n=1 Tax=Streptomyces sp. D2-8 TaxID=2707767 RepID=UPI0020BE09BB|nr:antitoxin [Streptomyces sp. D2-8]MCK8435611.1 antitoxin [Streptomyces sp. D2-8]
MGLLENVKAKLGPALGKVSDLAHRHEGKIHHGLDKAAHAVDKRTKGKYSDRIQSGTGRAKHAMDRLTHHGDTPHTGGTTAPPGTGRTAPSRDAAPSPDAGGTPRPEAPPPTS